MATFRSHDTWDSVVDGGHWPMLSVPEPLARALAEIRVAQPVLRPALDREHRTNARLRDGTDPASEERRAFFEALWAEYAPFAPKRLLEYLQSAFHQRWWEMQLTVALLRLGFAVETSAADAGPSATLEVDGARLFVEAVAPMAGTKADRVPAPVPHGAVEFPERECL